MYPHMVGQGYTHAPTHGWACMHACICTHMHPHINGQEYMHTYTCLTNMHMKKKTKESFPHATAS